MPYLLTRVRQPVRLLPLLVLALLLSDASMANTMHKYVSQHAPIGVMGDHMHKQGEWMFSYRHMTMTMEDNVQGRDRISKKDVFDSGYMVTPLEMKTTMDMLGVMYAPSDQLTLMLMVSYLNKDMDLAMKSNGTVFSTNSSGWSDTKISALISLFESQDTQFHLNLGLSLPTGSITQSDNLPNMGNKRLAYPMQLGSGTYDLEPGITYNGKSDHSKWGSQIKGVFRLDDNNHGYTLGNQLFISSWASYRINNWLATGVRLTFTDSEKIDGQDDKINTLMLPSAKAKNFGGERLDFSVSMTLLGNKPEQSGHQIGIEYTTTIDQDANGIQMEMQDMLTIGYQFTL